MNGLFIFQPFKFYHQQHLTRANRALSILMDLIVELGQLQLLRYVFENKTFI